MSPEETIPTIVSSVPEVTVTAPTGGELTYAQVWDKPAEASFVVWISHHASRRELEMPATTPLEELKAVTISSFVAGPEIQAAADATAWPSPERHMLPAVEEQSERPSGIALLAATTFQGFDQPRSTQEVVDARYHLFDFAAVGRRWASANPWRTGGAPTWAPEVGVTDPLRRAALLASLAERSLRDDGFDWEALANVDRDGWGLDSEA